MDLQDRRSKGLVLLKLRFVFLRLNGTRRGDMQGVKQKPKIPTLLGRK